MFTKFLLWIEDWFTKGGKRTHALVAVIGPVSLCIGFLWLCWAAAFKQRSLAAEITFVGGAIVTVTGWIYNIGKKQTPASEYKQDEKEPGR